MVKWLCDKPMHKYKLEKIRIPVFIYSFIAAISGFIIIGFLVSGGADGRDLVNQYAPIFLHDTLALAPEPVERKLYILSLFYFPIFTPAFYFFFSHLIEKSRKFRALQSNWLFQLTSNLILIQIILWWAVIVIISSMLDLGRGAGTYDAYHHIIYYLALLIPGAVTLGYKKLFWEKRHLLIRTVSILFIVTSSLYIFKPDGLYLSDFGLRHNLEPLLGSIAHAVSGMTELVDYNSQYGILYPHIGEIIFRFIPLTLTNINLFFTGLIIISWLFIYLVIEGMIGRGSLFSLIAILAVAGISHPIFEAYSFQNPLLVPYFQYNPVRTVFGMFFIYFVFRFISKETTIKYLLGMVGASFAVLWNVDTGVVVFLSFFLFLVYHTFSLDHLSAREKFKGGLMHLISGVFFLTLAVLAYNLFAYARSGSFPQWDLMFQFQSIFYQSGFMMLPMDSVGIWHIPLLIYFGTLVFTLVRLATRSVGKWDGYYFYMSVYGLGIFAFYQGRSHILNLFPVIYPAMLLVVFLIRDLLIGLDLKSFRDLFSKGILNHWNITLLVFLVIILSHGVLNSVILYPQAFSDFFKSLSGPTKTPEKKLTDRIAFVKGNKPNGNIMIIADDENLIHLYTHTRSQMPVDDFNEVYLFSQAEKVKALAKSDKIDKIFTDDTTDLARYLKAGEYDREYLGKYVSLP